ncbi:hypothetical protein J3R30DRAFT_3700854 [Lentinula aciculospora]|uniref:Uncharacterized protein n=1 Tax=Lentinula aciculospora TaxID=153920 RepID=A0A9W9AF52_9AGAR|nr:hypothetical protein J3R30DRAFT_3700854 [Lentinula aciculospora]
MPPGNFFYIALEEANVASRKHDEAFEDQHGRYPILKEILRGLRLRMGHLPIRFVVAGTMIPKAHFKSTVGEWDDFRWCSDTGLFGNPEEHRRYVFQFMPPEFASSFTGQTLLDRMWQWLRGRHRYTASFLAVLLHSNFQSPHKFLGNYIGRFTEYIPHDDEEHSAREVARFNDWYTPLASTGLRERSLSTAEMHCAAIAFLSTSKGCFDCSTTDRILITEDYGYFIDPDCSEIALDEPLTVTYGAGWLKENSYFGLAKFIRIFYKRNHLCKTSYAFNIIGLSSSLPLVKLVIFTRVVSRVGAVEVHLWEDAFDRLVLMAETAEEKHSWFRARAVILIFCLQLVDTRCFWVFVLVSSKSTNDVNHDLVQDIQNLDPNEVFRDQPDIPSLLNNLPNPCLDMGAFAVLRISGSCWPEKATADSIPAEHRPAGVLNIERLDEQKKKPEPAPLPTTIEETHAKKGKKRGRSRTIADDAGAAASSVAGAQKSKIVKSAKEGAAVAGPSTIETRRKKKTVNSTNADTVPGSSGQFGKRHETTRKTLRSRGSQGRVGEVATGRALTAMSRPNRVGSTASSTSTSPYNLRKRRLISYSPYRVLVCLSGFISSYSRVY